MSSPPGIDESGYAASGFAARVAAPQLPALPERTCPLMRDARLGMSDTPNCDDWFAAVGVVALAIAFPAMGDYMLVIIRESLAAVQNLVLG